MFVSEKRLWLTADKETVVEDGDPQAAFLLVCEGGTLDMETAKKYGLTEPKVEVKAVEAAPENKAIESAPENKATKGRPKK